MVPASYGLGYGYAPNGLGQPALVQGTDFKCADKAGKALPICFGIGAANHALLQQLQQKINRFSSSRQFTPLIVDGFIGPLTVAAMAKMSEISGTDTKEQIAANAPAIVAELDNIATTGGEQLAPTGTPVQPTTQTAKAAGVPAKVAEEVTVSTTAPTTADAEAAVAALPEQKSFLPWVLGGLAAVVIVGAVGYAYYRHKATQSAPAPARPAPQLLPAAPKAALGKGSKRRSKKKQTSKRRSRR